MLTPEHAKERLKEFQVKDQEAALLTAAAVLPEAPRTVCYNLVGRDQDGKLFSGQNINSYTVREKATVRLLAFNDADRRAVFTTFFPTLAPHVEAAWQFHNKLPYQSSHSRRPFRAPSHPVRADSARAAWFQRLLAVTRPYDGQSLGWFAAWAPYIASYYGDALGILLAAAVDKRDAVGDEVYEILLASARGEHEIGMMGRHVSRALLAADRPEGWEFMEKFLLAAQRQEGLRQVILEAVDEAHPQAFRRMLKVIRENDLTRFSATIRAIDVWLGFGWDAMSARFAAKALEQIETALDHPERCAETVMGDDLQAAYLALWAAAFDDAPGAVLSALPLLQHPDTKRRFVAAYFLVQTGLPEASAALLPQTDDPDLRVALLALRAELHGDDLFERLERLVNRLPSKPSTLDPLVWDWTTQVADKASVADKLPALLGERSPQRLIVHLPHLSSYGRGYAVREFAKAVSEPEVRKALLGLVGDPAEFVRRQALEAITKAPLGAGEAERMEALLTRKTGDLRRGVLSLLLAQADAPAQESAKRLLAARDPLPRQGGLELLRQMVKTDRSSAECRTAAAEYKASVPKISERESALLDQLLDIEREEPILDNGLGLFDPNRLHSTHRPYPAGTDEEVGRFPAKASAACVPTPPALCWQVLKELIAANGTQVIRSSFRAVMRSLLGNICSTAAPSPDFTKPQEENWETLPLADLWLNWWETRPAEMRDPDGLEIVRALALFHRQSSRSYYYQDGQYSNEDAEGSKERAELD